MATLTCIHRSFASHRSLLSRSALAAAAFAGLALAGAYAGAIAPADLLVYQQGDGTTAPPTDGPTPLDILEINPSLTAQTTPVQTFQISSQSSPLFSSPDGSDGLLSLSDNGTLLAFAGWTTAASGTVAQNTVLGRGAGTLNAAGVYSQPSASDYTGVSGNQTRSAVSLDGSTFYFADKGGIYTNGGTSPANSSNVRVIKAFGSTLFALQQSKTLPLLSVVTPSQLDGSSTDGLTPIPGFSSVFDNNAVDFTMVTTGSTPGLFDTLYVTDNTGILKYNLVSGTWTAEGSITGLGKNLDGITATVGAGGVVDLYVTSDSTTNGDVLEEVTDSSAFGASANDATPTITNLYTAPAGVLLAGVSTAPVSAVPEPASAGLLLFGAIGLLARRRRKA